MNQLKEPAKPPAIKSNPTCLFYVKGLKAESILYISFLKIS